MRIVLEGRTPFLELEVRSSGKGNTVELDASGLTYACPLELVGIPVLLATALHGGHRARLILPRDPNIASYLQRMDVLKCISDKGAEIDGCAPEEVRQDHSNSLLELTEISDAHAVESWNAKLFRLVEYQSDRGTAQQIFHIVGEVLGNALSHGAGPVGAFAVAQYYSGRTSERPAHIEIAIADGGRGILDHLRELHSGLVTAQEAIELSLTQGVSGIADSNRGHGLDEVDAVGQQLGGRILIRSTDGLGHIEFTGRRPLRAFFGARQSLPGTWVHIDLHIPQSRALVADTRHVVSLKQ